MTGVIGSGFGLYGHLPALFLSGDQNVGLIERYRTIIQKRPELANFMKHIHWFADEKALCEKADSMVISTWPEGQEQWINTCLSYVNIQTFILEKPLAVSPRVSKRLLAELIDSGRRFRINYSFIYTSWFNKLAQIVANTFVTSIGITWRFKAHHYKNNLTNWKRDTVKGGGAIRFYGIHLVALLAAIGFSNVLVSKTQGISETDCAAWQAQLTNMEQAVCTLSVDTYSPDQEQFLIEVNYTDRNGKPERLRIDLRDPFTDEITVSSDQDIRVGIIGRLYDSLNNQAEDEPLGELYASVNTIWQTIEQKNDHSLFNNHNL